MTKKDGKIYGLVGGSICVLFINFGNPQNLIGHSIVSISYALSVVLGLFSLILWIWHLPKDKSMINTTFDNFVYAFAGVSMVYSAIISVVQGRIPILN